MALDVPSGYRALKEADVAAYLAGFPAIAASLGGKPADWKVREVGDGNLNLVFIVEGPESGVVVKQALPYVRLVGESWPLPLRRAFFEHQALTAQARLAPAHVPKVFHFDESLALTVMAYLKPHIILRKGLIRGTVYPKLADHMATFMAETLFATSDLGQPAADKKKQMALFCGNTELCRITEDLVFTDPWRVAEANRWTSPQLDVTAAAVRADGPWKRAAQELKLKFLGERAGADPWRPAFRLDHGDRLGDLRHRSGVRLLRPDGLRHRRAAGQSLPRLLRPERPRGQGRRARRLSRLDPGDRRAGFALFDRRFRALWNTRHAGETFAPGLFAEAPARRRSRRRRMPICAACSSMSLGFAGCKMTRRILGLAHVEDLESIADPTCAPNARSGR